ncbi:hypothetical protein [Staphylococcus agnetis]|uniref:Uncharacterized protein n=1 Tax=Staphylococcus agnetis TaxID=985762 RepID=A0ABX3Z0W6_9STAP|nr:hypothetical protein [Staphylococcus agnetis]MDG4943930.1 hypothetical protein [Staphylococcus agnetis]OSP22585.1 hypothetical protein B9L42_00465 [Staphylococcus agnetis]OSP23124.1 hypothetical protein B9M87_09330 [Staphylococcus agnetis]OTW30521.1 hypothetical protein B9M88_09640 [Staphylococcus agnetis]
MKIKEAIAKLKEQGLDLREEKAIFRLKDGALELYLDEDEKTLKTEIHDLKVVVSDDLNKMDMMNVAYQLANMYKMDN